MKTIDLRRGWLVLGLAMLALPSTAQDLLQASSDTTIRVGTNGVDLPDEGIGMLDQAGTVLRQPLPGIPQGAELTAYAVEPGDAVILLSFANDVALPGPVFARGGDVVRFEDFGYAIGLDAGAAGLPRSARIDGVSSTGSGGLLISFDTTVELGAGLVAADEDLVDWNGSSFSLALDASGIGIDPSLDVDAVHDQGSSKVVMSFDAAGSVAGISFADEDLLEYDIATDNWQLLDLSALDPDWAASDLDAIHLPEPGLAWAFGAGSVLLAGLGRRKRNAAVAVRATGERGTRSREESSPLGPSEPQGSGGSLGLRHSPASWASRAKASRKGNGRPSGDDRPFGIGSGGGIRTPDLRVMSPTSYQTALPRSKGRPWIARPQRAVKIGRSPTKRALDAIGCASTPHPVHEGAVASQKQAASPRDGSCIASIILYKSLK